MNKPWTLKLRPKETATIDLDNPPSRIEISPVDPNELVMVAFLKWYLGGVMNIFPAGVRTKTTILIEVVDET